VACKHALFVIHFCQDALDVTLEAFPNQWILYNSFFFFLGKHMLVEFSNPMKKFECVMSLFLLLNEKLSARGI
jgi:hypothetical protein